jgi:hypothetical protein
LHEAASNVHIVVLEDHEVPGEVSCGCPVQRPDELLGRLVGRVSLAGEEEPNRAVGVFRDPAQPLRVAQEEGCPLVSGEAASEADS